MTVPERSVAVSSEDSPSLLCKRVSVTAFASPSAAPTFVELATTSVAYTARATAKAIFRFIEVDEMRFLLNMATVSG